MKLKERNKSVFGMADTRSDYGFRCACVFIKIHKYIASSRHQLIRRLNNLNRFVAGRKFRLRYYSVKNVSISTDVFSLMRNFL